jgi:hypothetical protein
LLIIASQLSVFCQNIPLTFDEATKTERTGFLASFLRQIKKNRREVDSWLIDLTNRGNRCLYHVRIFRDLYISAFAIAEAGVSPKAIGLETPHFAENNLSAQH